MVRSTHRGHTERTVRRASCGLLWITAILMPMWIPLHAQSLSSAEDELLRAEDALFQADVTRNVAAIDRGFAAEAVFVHANGTIQSKAAYLRAVTTANFQSIVGTDRVVRVFGKVGVIRGTKNLVLANGLHLSGSYLTVYVMREGRWQMLDQQSAPAPQAE